MTPPGRIATETPTRERRGILSSAQDGEEREREEGKDERSEEEEKIGCWVEVD